MDGFFIDKLCVTQDHTPVNGELLPFLAQHRYIKVDLHTGVETEHYDNLKLAVTQTDSKSFVNHPAKSENSKNAYPDFKPVIPGVPSSAPAYAGLNVVTQSPQIIGCIKTPEFCRCYTKQAVNASVSSEFCETFLAGNYFNPFRAVKSEIGAVAALFVVLYIPLCYSLFQWPQKPENL